MNKIIKIYVLYLRWPLIFQNHNFSRIMITILQFEGGQQFLGIYSIIAIITRGSSQSQTSIKRQIKS